MKRFRVMAGSESIPEDAAMTKESSSVQALPPSPSCVASRLHAKSKFRIESRRKVFCMFAT